MLSKIIGLFKAKDVEVDKVPELEQVILTVDDPNKNRPFETLFNGQRMWLTRDLRVHSRKKLFEPGERTLSRTLLAKIDEPLEAPQDCYHCQGPVLFTETHPDFQKCEDEMEYLCLDCGARTKAIRLTDIPNGVLANANMRKLRTALWRLLGDVQFDGVSERLNGVTNAMGLDPRTHRLTYLSEEMLEEMVALFETANNAQTTEKWSRLDNLQ